MFNKEGSESKGDVTQKIEIGPSPKREKPPPSFPTLEKAIEAWRIREKEETQVNEFCQEIINKIEVNQMGWHAYFAFGLGQRFAGRSGAPEDSKPEDSIYKIFNNFKQLDSFLAPKNLMEIVEVPCRYEMANLFLVPEQKKKDEKTKYSVGFQYALDNDSVQPREEKPGTTSFFVLYGVGESQVNNLQNLVEKNPEAYWEILHKISLAASGDFSVLEAAPPKHFFPEKLKGGWYPDFRFGPSFFKGFNREMLADNLYIYRVKESEGQTGEKIKTPVGSLELPDWFPAKPTTIIPFSKGYKTIRDEI